MGSKVRILIVFLGLMSLLGLTTTLAFAQDPDNGKVVWEESLCARCHGAEGEGVWGKPLAGDAELTLEDWIPQVREPRRRMPAFSEEQISDDQIADMFAYMTSLDEPEETGFQEVSLPSIAHPGQALILEKRCIACHSLTGPVGGFIRRGEEPTAEAVLTQLRTPRNRMPRYKEEQVSDEEAAIITEFLLLQQQRALQPVPDAVTKAVTGVGGEEGLQGLSSFFLDSRGIRWRIDESFNPGDPAARVGAFRVQVLADLENDKLRLDYRRQGFTGERQVSEVIAGEVGYIEGQDAVFGPPGAKPMPSDRWASTRKQQRLLNPHLILRDIVAGSTIASEVGETLVDGSVHHLVTVEDEVAPLTLYINAGTGRIAKLATMENDHLRRDVSLEVFYYNWQPVGDLSFPTEVYLALDGEILLKEIRTGAEVNPSFEPAVFEMPADVAPVFDEELAARGEFSHQFNQLFAAGGFIKDGAQTEINAEEISAGVFHLTGVANNSMVVEQADSVVVVEGPLHQYRSEAIIDWVTETFPDKPISHVTSTHHHTDHSGGLRTFVANGAAVVLHEAAEAYFSQIFQARSTLLPDALALNPVEAVIETASAEAPFVIEDDQQPVEVHAIENGHAADMAIIYLPEAGIVFVSDLYSPNPGANPGAGGQLVYDAIVEAGLDVSLIAGGHGVTITFEEFEALLEGQ